MLCFGLILALLVPALAALLAFLFLLEAPQKPLPPAPPSRPGLWFMAHRADRRFPFQHCFIRLTPADPSWAARRPDLFGRADAAGRPYCTLGAGPRGGKLFLEFNRGFDLGDPVGFEEPAGASGGADAGGAVEAENRRIEALLRAASDYGQGLGFTAWSRVTGRGYNCNSMIHELAARAGLALPRFARVWMLCPGMGRGLPARAFHKATDV